MTTLKQILIEKCNKHKEIQNCSWCRFEKDCNARFIPNLITEAVREWLQQKLEESKKPVCPDHRKELVIAWLLEQLQK